MVKIAKIGADNDVELAVEWRNIGWLAEEVIRVRAQKDALLAAAKLALTEMCNTAAPRNSFTDAVDALDAAISKASKGKS